MLTASCHCGAVRIEVARKPSVLRRCTCSICRRYGALWAYYSRKTARVLSPPKAASPYVWNDGVIAFYHCRACGCLTHYEGTEIAKGSRIAVNCRMMAPEAIAGTRVSWRRWGIDSSPLRSYSTMPPDKWMGLAIKNRHALCSCSCNGRVDFVCGSSRMLGGVERSLDIPNSVYILFLVCGRSLSIGGLFDSFRDCRSRSSSGTRSGRTLSRSPGRKDSV